ncbi:copper resistance protein [Escherichia coli]|nr:copper resistance protein [Salmonella enterica subsp. enterica serovar Reading]EFD7800962.1 copper resistance protein [Escherichia coli]EFE8044520.1 copper resistance protein [Escherichia coli]EFH9628492.1 copper resistance protein [Escherichia coli]
MSIKNDGHYFCRAGGNRPDGLNEPVTFQLLLVWMMMMEQQSLLSHHGCD